MLVSNIVNAVNTKLAGETLTYNQLKLFLDEVIDDINAELNAEYPAISDYLETEDYNLFPDRYIRKVVIAGAASKFYVTDEEGINTATQYHYDYQDNLFLMKRDWSDNVPTAYRSTNTGSISNISDAQAELIATDPTYAPNLEAPHSWW